MKRKSAAAAAAALAFFGLATEIRAAPAPIVYAVSIGQNEIPAPLLTPDQQGLRALRYADDDAAAFHAFMSGLSRRSYLLSMLDADTQQRFPDLVKVARLPTRAEVMKVVASLEQAMTEDLAAGHEPVLVLFYSGHGVRDESGGPGLALFDRALSQASLYDDILAKLPARFVHLIVDACHAEAVVRPRDAEAAVEPLTPEQQAGYLHAATLARFPQVGALLASAASAQSFEWEEYRGGVFAHEVLSGLRGGADVNGDGRVEYSELAAFLAAANAQIAEPEARPQIVVQPPRTDRRAPIVDLARLEGHFRLGGRARAPWSGPFHVETENGVRVLDAYPERDARIAYRLPAGVRLYIVAADGESEITAASGAELSLDGLVRRAARARARGALQASMRRGLFATAFGPGFYRGYVSRGGLPPVPLPAADAASPDLSPPPALIATAPPPARDGRRLAGQALLVGAGAGAVAAGLFGVLAWNAQGRYEATSFERTAAEERARFDRYRTFALISVAGAGVAGLSAGALLLWPRARSTGPGLDGVAFTGSGLHALGRF